MAARKQPAGKRKKVEPKQAPSKQTPAGIEPDYGPEASARNSRRERENRERNIGADRLNYQPSDVISARSCCQCPCEELGQEFARLLAEPESLQQGVCAQLGLDYRKHMRWLATDPEESTLEGLAAYKSIVLQALDRQRRLHIGKIQRNLNDCNVMKSGPQMNLDKFLHENRFRRFYGDEERKRVELSGPDGEALPSTQVQYLVAVPADEPEEPQGPTN